MIRDVWEGIRSEPRRVLLSFFSATIGIMSLTLLLAVLGGLSERARLLVQDLGGNVIAVVPGLSQPGKDAAGLSRRHADILMRHWPECRVSGLRRFDLPVQGTEEHVTVVATDENLAGTRGWIVQQGRFLDAWDCKMGERHAVLSQGLADKLRLCLGDMIRLEKTPCLIVGFVKIGGAAVENNDRRINYGDSAVFIPAAAPIYEQGAVKKMTDQLDMLFIRIPAGKNAEDYVRAGERLLNSPELAINNISWITPESLLRGIRRMQNAVRLAGGSIAFLCLVLGGTTLMSLMLANVRDRITEIGLRRALGATALDVATLFVFEACLVTVAAALVGILGTVLLMNIVRGRFLLEVSLGWGTLLLPIFVSLVTGVVFSYWPARLAAGITPAEALRNE